MNGMVTCVGRLVWCRRKPPSCYSLVITKRHIFSNVHFVRTPMAFRSSFTVVPHLHEHKPQNSLRWKSGKCWPPVAEPEMSQYMH